MRNFLTRMPSRTWFWRRHILWGRHTTLRRCIKTGKLRNQHCNKVVRVTCNKRIFLIGEGNSLPYGYHHFFKKIFCAPLFWLCTVLSKSSPVKLVCFSKMKNCAFQDLLLRMAESTRHNLDCYYQEPAVVGGNTYSWKVFETLQFLCWSSSSLVCLLVVVLINSLLTWVMVYGVGSQTNCEQSARPSIEEQQPLPSKRFCARCEVCTFCINLSNTSILCLFDLVWMFRVSALILTAKLVRFWSFFKWTSSAKLQRETESFSDLCQSYYRLSQL